MARLDLPSSIPLDRWPDPDGEPCVLPAGHALAPRYSVPRRVEPILPPREGMMAITQTVPGTRPGDPYEILTAALPLHQVVVVLEGVGERFESRMLGRSQAMVARPGHVCVIPAGVESRWTGPTAHSAHMLIAVSQRRADAIAEEIGCAAGRAAMAPRVGQHDAGIAALAEALRHEQATYGISALYAAQASMLLTMRLLRLDVPAPRGYALTPRRLRAVRDFAEANIASEIGLDALAAAAGLSRFHFARAFRHETGNSPAAWLRSLRCDRARAMLAETDLPVQAVARACGFVSPAHFSNAFRDAFGMPPRRWRAQHCR